MDVAYGNDVIPKQGTGQGNGNGPTVWGLISTKMIVMMKNKGHGIRLWSSISLAFISIVCFAFVDDEDLVVNVSYCYTTEEYLQEPF